VPSSANGSAIRPARRTGHDTQVRAEAAREREELRARAERAEHQADTYRDELRQLRAASAADGTGSGPAPVKTARRAARTPAT
jgi:hypothetical protein